MITDDVHAENSRHVAHARHREPIYELLFYFIEQQLVSTQQKEVVSVERQQNKADLVFVDVHPRLRLEWPKPDVAEALVYRTN